MLLPCQCRLVQRLQMLLAAGHPWFAAAGFSRAAALAVNGTLIYAGRVSFLELLLLLL
jgi:hypothetical protein